jgi:hypothetical protein
LVLPLAGHGTWLFFGLLPVTIALSLVPSATFYLDIESPISLDRGDCVETDG